MATVPTEDLLTMHKTIAFVNAFIIASSLLSCVCSLPTQPLEADLEIFSSTPAPSPTCFEAHPSPYNHEIRNIKQYAVDSEGRSCFENIKEPRFERLLDETTFENNYANETAKFCQDWPRLKQCLKEHVNSDRCNEENIQLVIESVYVNTIHIVPADLLCNPAMAPGFRNLWKRMLSTGLLNCAFGKDIRELADECEAKKFDEGGHHARFQNLGLYSDCMKPGVRTCANEDHVKEVQLVQVWDEISRAILDAHKAFWN